MSGQHIGSYDQIARLPSHPEGISELGRKDQAGGYLGIPQTGPIFARFGQDVDTEANIMGKLLEAGELAYASDTQSWFVGDGVTSGGSFLWQKPQVKHTAYSSLASVASPSTPLTDEDGCLIAVGPNQRHIVDIAMMAEGDTESQSNFAVRLSIGESAPSGLSDQVYASIRWEWGDASTGNQIDAGCRNFFANILLTFPAVLAPVSDLTRGSMAFGARWMFRTFDRESPPNLPSVVVVPRTGSTSPAYATLTTVSQRIA